MGRDRPQSECALELVQPVPGARSDSAHLTPLLAHERWHLRAHAVAHYESGFASDVSRRAYTAYKPRIGTARPGERIRDAARAGGARRKASRHLREKRREGGGEGAAHVPPGRVKEDRRGRARRIWRIVALGVCLEIRHVSGRRADRHRHLRRGVWGPCGSERVGVDGGERGAFR